MDQRRKLAEGKFLRLIAADGWEWVERVNAAGAAVIAAVTTQRELVLVEQLRIPLGKQVLDLPAGLVGDEPGTAEEPMIAAARRELLEETGYESSRWEHAVAGPSSPGLTTEAYTLFLAWDARRVGPGGGTPAERIHVHVVPLASLEAWLETQRCEGLVVDPKIYLAIHFIERAAGSPRK